MPGLPGRLVLGGSLDSGLGEGHPEVVVLSQVVVVQVDERLNGLLHGTHLNQRHLAILLEELEPFDNSAVAGEEYLEVVLRYGGRDVGKVQGGRGWEDVLEVLRARLLEAVQG